MRSISFINWIPNISLKKYQQVPNDKVGGVVCNDRIGFFTDEKNVEKKKRKQKSVNTGEGNVN